MDDLISRQAAIDTLCTICELYGYCDGGDGDDPCDDVKALKHLPSAQTIEPERKKGWWIDVEIGYVDGVRQEYRCSVCSRVSLSLGNFCPHCGADMRGDSDG